MNEIAFAIGNSIEVGDGVNNDSGNLVIDFRAFRAYLRAAGTRP